MYYLVYKITNILNGKTYIGAHKTYDINDGYMGSGKALRHAIKKYGIENFIKEIIYEASTLEEMFLKEKELVKLGQDTYNIKEGGSGGWDYVNKKALGSKWFKDKYSNDPIFREEHLKRTKYANQKFREKFDSNPVFREQQITNSLRGLEISHKNNPNGTFYGKKHTELTKTKMSSAKQGVYDGVKHPQYGMHWMMKNGENKKVKPENVEAYIQDGWIKGRTCPRKQGSSVD